MLTKRVNLFCWAFLFVSLTSVAQTTEENEQTPDYALVFENSEVLSFHVTISPENWAKMQPKLPEQTSYPTLEQGKTSQRSSMFRFTFEYVKGTVKFGDEVYPDVGIRFKGNSSVVLSLESLKKPYKFDFDKFVEGQTFHGFKKLNFSNSTLDPSLMREKLAYDLFRKAGVPAPKATFAKLYLTVDGKYENEYVGLYVMVEQVDERFLQKVFGNSKGLLVKRTSLGDLAYLGDEWKSYKDSFDLESPLPPFSKGGIRGDCSDPSRLIQFVKLLYQASDEQFEAEVEQFLNVDSFLVWLAVNTLLTNLDSYAGMGHNYYTYLNEETGRFEFIPWDLNYAFGNFSLAGAPERRIDFDIYHPYTGRKILIERLLQVAKYQEQYLAHLRKLIEGPFHPDAMHAEIDRLYALIRTAAVEDTHNAYPTEAFKHSISANVPLGMFSLSGTPIAQSPQPSLRLSSFGSFQQSAEPIMQVIGLKPFVTKRVESVRAQLAGEKQGYVIWTLVPPSAPPSMSSTTVLPQPWASKPNSFFVQYARANEPTARTTKVAPGPLKAGKVAGEILAGGLAGGGLGVAGGFIGAGIKVGLFPDNVTPIGDLLGLYIGFPIGYTIGCSLGVYWVGSRGDETGSYLATLGGSILGSTVSFANIIALWHGSNLWGNLWWHGVNLSEQVGVITFFSGPLIGALIGFNATRKKRSSFEPGDALLNFNEGKMCLAIPPISLRLRHSELIQRVDLVKVSF
jgi:hypothetical protein